MGITGMSRIERGLTERAEQRWARWARQAPRTAPGRLAAQAAAAHKLRHHLGEVIATADDRLPLHRLGSAEPERPPGCDWAWRPRLWQSATADPGLAGAESRSAIGDDITLFHDCPRAEIILRQTRQEGGPAPYGLGMEVFAFEGSFLSLVLELPAAAGAGLGKRHLVRLKLDVTCEEPLEIFARLNIRHGPNTEQIVREIPPGAGPAEVEFDLAYSALNEKRIERLWLDLIFERPHMNRVTLSDVTLLRHPRAEL
ncbi:DUF6478 family protein [Pseudoroseicyclus sp. H15]